MKKWWTLERTSAPVSFQAVTMFSGRGWGGSVLASSVADVWQ